MKKPVEPSNLFKQRMMQQVHMSHKGFSPKKKVKKISTSKLHNAFKSMNNGDDDEEN